MGSEEKIAQIRDWLRYHGEYDVRISLHSVYATIGIELCRNGVAIWSDIGMTWEKRLDNVLAEIARVSP